MHGERADRAQSLRIIPWHSSTTEEKSMEKPLPGEVEKCQLGTMQNVSVVIF